MNDAFKKVANDGVDVVGTALINLLPINGMVRNALAVGLDKGTDLIFDNSGEKVPLKEHSEIRELANNLVPLILLLVDRGVLKLVDIPYLNEENESKFEQGVLLQLEAVLRQTIQDYFE